MPARSVHSRVSVRVVLAFVALIFAAGCARGIAHTMEAVDEAEAIAPNPAPAPMSVDAATDAAVEADANEAVKEEQPATCAATANDEACFECCDAKYPKAIDIWSDALDACCPNDDCTDEAYEKCEIAADDLCAKDPECAGLEACEEKSGCWEKVSSER